MKLVDYIEILRARVLLVVATVLVVLGISVAISFSQSPTYSASARIRILPAAPGATGQSTLQTASGQADPDTEAQLVTSDQVAQRVKAQLGLSTPVESLIKQVQVGVLPSTSVLQVTATAGTGGAAVSLANAFSNEYLAVRRAQASADLQATEQGEAAQLARTQHDLETVEAQLAGTASTDPNYAVLQNRRDQDLATLDVENTTVQALADRAAVAGGFGDVIQPAGVDAGSATHNPRVRTVVFGVLIGLPLALALVLLLDAIGDRLRGRDDAARQAGADVLGMIPSESTSDPARGAGPVTLTDPFSPAAEAYRTLGYNLAKVAEGAGVRTVLVTSPGEGEGKTSVAANVSHALAEAGLLVTALDADLRSPGLAAVLGGDAEPGLTDLLEGRRTDLPAQRLAPNLAVVAAGPAVSRPDLAMLRGDMPRLFAEAAGSNAPRGANGRRAARDEGDLLIVDAPPVLQASEVSRLAAAADGVVLVVRGGTTRRKAAAAAAEQIRRSGGQVIGVVMTGVRASSDLGVVGSYGPPAGRATTGVR